jgi:hypothetical protein
MQPTRRALGVAWPGGTVLGGTLTIPTAANAIFAVEFVVVSPTLVRQRTSVLTIPSASASPPVVATTPATGIGSSAAIMNGTVNANGIATTYQFESGTTTSYGTTTVAASGGSGASAVARLPSCCRNRHPTSGR